MINLHAGLIQRGSCEFETRCSNSQIASELKGYDRQNCNHTFLDAFSLANQVLHNFGRFQLQCERTLTWNF
jgi:hypothetical protein